MMMRRGWIGVDLDGTLAFYEHWTSATHIGDPIPAMVERVKRWIAEDNYDVHIFTARVSDPDEAPAVAEAIHQWCEKHIGRRLVVTKIKDYAMVELWDDRAVQVIANMGEPVGKSTRGLE